MGDVAGPALLERLRAAIPASRVLTDHAALDAYSHDDAEWAPYEAPLAVVLAETAEEVAAAVRIAGETGTHVVARGSGTGLSGGANAVADCIVVSLERMTAVLEIN